MILSYILGACAAVRPWLSDVGRCSERRHEHHACCRAAAYARHWDALRSSDLYKQIETAGCLEILDESIDY